MCLHERRFLRLCVFVYLQARTRFRNQRAVKYSMLGSLSWMQREALAGGALEGKRRTLLVGKA